MRAVMPMIGISSVMSRHCVGAVFWLTNSQHALDPATNAPCHTAHNSTHKAADRSKYLIEKARVTAFRARCGTNAHANSTPEPSSSSR
jgi:hypothetical protein